MAAATAPDWTLQIIGPRPYALTLDEVEEMAVHEARFPMNCGEGWSVDAPGAGCGCWRSWSGPVAAPARRSGFVRLSKRVRSTSR